MKVLYVHASEPKREKIHDTVKSLQSCRGFIELVFGDKKTQEEWDKEELARFERDFRRGLVLSYSVMRGDDIGVFREGVSAGCSTG